MYIYLKNSINLLFLHSVEVKILSLYHTTEIKKINNFFQKFVKSRDYVHVADNFTFINGIKKKPLSLKPKSMSKFSIRAKGDNVKTKT